MRLCIALCVLFVCGLLATAAHADEAEAAGEAGGAAGESTSGESVLASDAMTARLESEVLRYYRGIGVDPTEAELKSGFRAASEMVLADVAIEQISLAVDEAIKRHEKGEDVPFELAIPRFVRALAEEEARSIQGDASEAAQQPAWRAAADQKIRELRPRARAETPAVKGDVSEAVRPPRPRERLGKARHRYDWRSSFHFEINRQGRDWANVTGIMSGVFGGVALAGVIPSAGQGCGGGDICPGLYVTMGHMIALGSANQLSGSVAASLGGIHWLVANTADPEILIAKLRRRRIATGIAALSVGIAAVVSIPALDYAWFGSGLAGGGALGLVAFSLLAVSSAHFRFEADFKRMITAGYVGSQHKPTHPKVALVPTIAPRPGGLSLGLAGVF